MVLYVHTVYDQGTLLRSCNALVKSKEMAATLTFEAVEKQSCAMGVQVFEIGLFDPNAAEGAMLPRLWNLDTLLRSVSWLRLKNAEGRHIYIRPAGEHYLSLLDDASIQAVERLKSEGFAPAVVLETSPENFQAWLCHGQILPKQLSTFAARLLASRFGTDPV
jgi:DNA primase RepB-like protein